MRIRAEHRGIASPGQLRLGERLAVCSRREQGVVRQPVCVVTDHWCALVRVKRGVEPSAAYQREHLRLLGLVDVAEVQRDPLAALTGNSFAERELDDRG